MNSMKTLASIIICLFCTLSATAQTKKNNISVPDSSKRILIVEASCGECKFKMKGNGCDLAVRIDGKPYYVAGTSIDEHGDAHADDGFCKAIRKAEVQGEIIDDKFVATYFKVIE
jgi:hypothetical protein